MVGGSQGSDCTTAVRTVLCINVDCFNLFFILWVNRLPHWTLNVFYVRNMVPPLGGTEAAPQCEDELDGLFFIWLRV